MLPNAGYFRGINCPSIIKQGHCSRPYCHFRHNPQTRNIAKSEEIEVNISQNQQTSNASVKVDSANISSVLHGAKGPVSSRSTFSRSSSVKYDVSYASKPVDDLEYDPMCNFNIKKHDSKPAKSSDLIVVDLIEDDLPSLRSTFSEESPWKYNNAENSAASRKKLETSSLKNSQEQSTNSLKLASEPIVILDSDEEIIEKPFVSVNSTSSKDKKLNVLNFESDLIGADSETDTAATVCKKVKLKAHASTKTTSDDLSKKGDSLDEVKKLSKAKKSSSASKLLNKKAVSKTSEEKIVKCGKDIVVTKEIKKRKSNTKISSLKRKKPKLSSSEFSSPTEIEKYVSKDEIEKLDKELNDVGMFDECYRIYQETLGGKVPDQTSIENSAQFNDNLPAVKPSKVFKDVVLDVAEDKVAANSVLNSLISGKNRRIARTAANTSARNLNRERKQAKQILTPAQTMMKRMEIIQREQEEQILSSVSKNVLSKRNTLTNSKTRQSVRVAHRPSSMLSTSISTLNKKPLSSTSISSYFSKKRRPFEDLRSKSSATTFTQSTIPKGAVRKAHVPADNTGDLIEKPTILPDRHSKVPTNIRQRYLTAFIDECLRIFGNNRSNAYSMAKSEEQKCNSRSKSKAIYLSLAASTLKRLRSQIAEDFNVQKKTSESSIVLPVKSIKTSPLKVAFKTNNIRVAHNTSPTKAAAIIMNKIAPKTKNATAGKSRRKNNFSILKEERQNSRSDINLYENLRRYLLTEEDLCVNGFPRPGKLPGTCLFAVDKPKATLPKEKRTCARCGKEFFMTKSGHFFNEDECIHHWGKAFPTKVGSHWEKRYSCCQTPSGSEGCSVGETHVHKENTYDCNGYVQTLQKANDSGNPGVYALDCEMAFTVAGLELIRISVVNFDGKLVYDTLVKPEGKILDYNTRWSGLTADDLKGAKASLHDVHAALLTRFSADTILIGHSLESDLVALRMIHSSVIDTSVAFPHRLGLPYKRALRTLMAENLGIIIQNSVDEGHDSMEDALACIKLMKWKLSEDSKVCTKSMQR